MIISLICPSSQNKNYISNSLQKSTVFSYFFNRWRLKLRTANLKSKNKNKFKSIPKSHISSERARYCFTYPLNSNEDTHSNPNRKVNNIKQKSIYTLIFK